MEPGKKRFELMSGENKGRRANFVSFFNELKTVVNTGAVELPLMTSG